MEAVHSGVKGDVIDGSTGQPVQNAKVGKFNYSRDTPTFGIAETSRPDLFGLSLPNRLRTVRPNRQDLMRAKLAKSYTVGVVGRECS